jgi:hypothetical protein
MPNANQLFLNAVALRYLTKTLIKRVLKQTQYMTVEQSFAAFKEEFSSLLQDALPPVLSNFLENVIPAKEITSFATVVLYHDTGWYKESGIPNFVTACHNSSKMVAKDTDTDQYTHRKGVQFQTLATTFMNRFINVLYYTYLLDTDFDNLVLCKPGQRAGEFLLFTGYIDSSPARWNAGEVVLPEPRTITDMQILKMLGIAEQQPLNDVLFYNKTPHLTGFTVEDLVKMNSAYSEANNGNTKTSTDETGVVQL